MFDGWKHDPNLTIEVLHRTLSNLDLRGRPIPPRLNLQLDNCGRENKKKFFSKLNLNNYVTMMCHSVSLLRCDFQIVFASIIH